MTEILAIQKEEPTTGAADPAASGVQPGEDGYFAVQLRLPMQNGERSGELHGVLKLNGIPDTFDAQDPDSIRVTFNHIADGQVPFPKRGFVSRMVIISIDTGSDVTLFNMVCENADGLRSIHLDYVAFAQLVTQRDNDFFLHHRPGTIMFMSVDFGHDRDKVPASTEEPVSESIVENDPVSGQAPIPYVDEPDTTVYVSSSKESAQPINTTDLDPSPDTLRAT